MRLAEKLVQITPASLTRVYLTLGGSELRDDGMRGAVAEFSTTIDTPGSMTPRATTIEEAATLATA